MAVGKSLTVAPCLECVFVAPAGVDEPPWFGVTSWAEQFEAFESLHRSHLGHAGFEALDDLIASLWGNVESVDLYESHGPVSTS